jgi:hypothetical protein
MGKELEARIQELGGPGRRNNRFWWGEAPERRYDFDEAASKLNPASGYTNTLAEPRYIARHGEPDCSANAYDHLGANQDASDTVDPRLGTGIAVVR